MGRYGHHNHRKNFNVSEDFDSSKPEKPDAVEQDWDSSNEGAKQNIASRLGSSIKQRYERYNSPDARMERRNNTLQKRSRKIEDLSYNAKKEGLKAQIRKSKNIAPTDYGFGLSGVSKKGNSRRSSSEGIVHFPKNNYGSMDRMFGIGSKPAKITRTKKQSSQWGSFDRMFGL